MFILLKLLQVIKWDSCYGEVHLGGWEVQQLLFENIMDWWDWEAYSRDLNTHFDDYKKAGKTMPQGSLMMIGICLKTRI